MAGVPKVDPFARKGLFTRAYAWVLQTRLGRWLAINGAARIDPTLIRVSRGYLSVGMTFPSVNLTMTGAKSGQPRTSTVLYFSDGDDVILIASNFGRDKHPSWYHNLKAKPAATLERKGGSGRYVAEEVEGEAERARLFSMGDLVYPGYAGYRERTRKVGRTIPIMRLRLASAPVAPPT